MRRRHKAEPHGDAVVMTLGYYLEGRGYDPDSDNRISRKGEILVLRVMCAIGGR